MNANAEKCFRALILDGGGPILGSDMDLLRILAKDPDQAVMVNNDEQVRMLLDQLGIAEVFSDEHGTPGSPTVQVCGFDGIRSHFVIVFLFSGLAQKSENGYLMTCAPRSGFAPELSTADFVSDAAREQSLKGLRVLLREPPNRN